MEIGCCCRTIGGIMETIICPPEMVFSLQVKWLME